MITLGCNVADAVGTPDLEHVTFDGERLLETAASMFHGGGRRAPDADGDASAALLAFLGQVAGPKDASRSGGA